MAQIVDALQADTGAARAVLDRDVKATLSQFLDGQIVTDLPEVDGVPTPVGGPVGCQPQSADRWADTVARLLDRVDWTTVIGPARAGSLDVVVRTDDPTLAHELLAAVQAPAPAEPSTPSLLVVISVRDPGRGRGPRWYVDGRRQWTGPNRDSLVDDIRTDITQRVLAADDRSVAAACRRGRAGRSRW